MISIPSVDQCTRRPCDHVVNTVYLKKFPWYIHIGQVSVESMQIDLAQLVKMTRLSARGASLTLFECLADASKTNVS